MHQAGNRTDGRSKGQGTRIVTGGASGLGAATARARWPRPAPRWRSSTSTTRPPPRWRRHRRHRRRLRRRRCRQAPKTAIDEAAADHGPARILVNCAGIGPAKRIVGRDGPMPLDDFERVIRINLIGTFNMMRLVAADMQALEPLADGERGVIVSTASVAAFEGQIGQAAYAASKGGVAALTMPAAREFAQFGIRVMAIAPGIFRTPMLKALPQETQDSLGASVPFPKRLGKPARIRRAGPALHPQRLSQRRGDPPRRRAAHGAALDARERATRSSPYTSATRSSGSATAAGRDSSSKRAGSTVSPRWCRPADTMLDIGCGPGKPIAAYLIGQRLRGLRRRFIADDDLARAAKLSRPTMARSPTCERSPWAALRWHTGLG